MHPHVRFYIVAKAAGEETRKRTRGERDGGGDNGDGLTSDDDGANPKPPGKKRRNAVVPTVNNSLNSQPQGDNPTEVICPESTQQQLPDPDETPFREGPSPLGPPSNIPSAFTGLAPRGGRTLFDGHPGRIGSAARASLGEKDTGQDRTSKNNPSGDSEDQGPLNMLEKGSMSEEEITPEPLDQD
ncbi:hypothetical protein BJX70DRAFT_404794 [Aspergillus crustosus]